jgi:signal transduction histidine kinase
MSSRHWPVALALVAIAILASYLLYTEQLVRAFRSDAEVHRRMYALVQRGLLSTEPGAELQALTDLQAELTRLGVPMVAVSPDGEPYAVANLPFEADLTDPTDRARVLRYAGQLAAANPMITDDAAGAIHFGPPPVIGRLRWAATLQVAGALLLLFVGYVVVRGALRTERERMWNAMARELAHQMGTPLSSLQGWLEVLRMPHEERVRMVPDNRLTQELGADLDRLERVSRRFELIGKPPPLAPIRPESIMRDLERYLRPRLPKEKPGVELRVRVARGLPSVRGNRVLLGWALENCVKNSLDALAGRGGTIRLAAMPDREGVAFLIADNGPGIEASVRDRLFEPGVSTKPGGWGVGLSLARRIAEDLHGGSIRSCRRMGGGARFTIRIPTGESDEPDRA